MQATSRRWAMMLQAFWVCPVPSQEPHIVFTEFADAESAAWAFWPCRPLCQGVAGAVLASTSSLESLALPSNLRFGPRQGGGSFPTGIVPGPMHSPLFPPVLLSSAMWAGSSSPTAREGVCLPGTLKFPQPSPGARAPALPRPAETLLSPSASPSFSSSSHERSSESPGPRSISPCTCTIGERPCSS